MAVRTLVPVMALFFLIAQGGAETTEEDFPRMPVCEHTINFPACPLVYRPLCGTDGNTYDNECLLCMTRMKNKQNIQILKDRPCEHPPESLENPRTTLLN